MVGGNKMIKFARQKGSRFERQLAKQLSKDFSADVIRTPMSGAFGTQVRISDWQGDLYSKGNHPILKQYFFEAKHVEGATYGNLRSWYEKAILQANSKVPVVFIRDNIHDYILVATDVHYLANLIKEKKLLSKVTYKTIHKKNINFWKEYEIIGGRSKIPLLLIDIVILTYENWLYIVREE